MQSEKSGQSRKYREHKIHHTRRRHPPSLPCPPKPWRRRKLRRTRAMAGRKAQRAQRTEGGCRGGSRAALFAEWYPPGSRRCRPSTEGDSRIAPTCAPLRGTFLCRGTRPVYPKRADAPTYRASENRTRAIHESPLHARRCGARFCVGAHGLCARRGRTSRPPLHGPCGPLGPRDGCRALCSSLILRMPNTCAPMLNRYCKSLPFGHLHPSSGRIFLRKTLEDPSGIVYNIGWSCGSAEITPKGSCPLCKKRKKSSAKSSSKRT